MITEVREMAVSSFGLNDSRLFRLGINSRLEDLGAASPVSTITGTFEVPATDTWVPRCCRGGT